MGLRDFLKLRRNKPAKPDDSAGLRHRPELRDAWNAFETDGAERALELAKPHLDSIDTELAADAKKLVALIQYRRGDYGDSLRLFRDVVAVHDDAGNWFNVCTAATLDGDIESGQRAFQKALAAREHGDDSDHLSLSTPFMRLYYACALRDRGEYRKALDQIDELRSIYEQLGITDTHFVYVRGVPFLSHTMDLAVDVFSGLGRSLDWPRWIDSFGDKLDDDGRAYLASVKQRLVNGTDQCGEQEPPMTRDLGS